MLSTLITVAGTSHHQREMAGMRPNDQIELIREPDNKFDPNAIKVVWQFRHVGYIPAEIAVGMAPLMDETGQVPTATIEEVTQYRPARNQRLVLWGLKIRVYHPGN